MIESTKDTREEIAEMRRGQRSPDFVSLQEFCPKLGSYPAKVREALTPSRIHISMLQPCFAHLMSLNDASITCADCFRPH